MISCESPRPADRLAAAELAALVVARTDAAAALSGAELCVGEGWLGLRSHPAPAWTVSFGGPDVPEWLDGVMRDSLGSSEAS